MTNEQYHKHLVLKEYLVLKKEKENAIADYCSYLTKLTKVTQNINPMPGHSSDSHYDESIFELAEKFMKVREIDDNMRMIWNAVSGLPFTENFVIKELYFHKRKIREVAALLNKSRSTIFNIRNNALDHLTLIRFY